MNRTTAKYLIMGILLLGCGLYFFYHRETETVLDTHDRIETQSPPQRQDAHHEEIGRYEDQVVAAFHEKGREEALDHPKDIEEIKKQVYALTIESVEDIGLLDRVVQTGDTPTRDFWQGDWVSVDDVKDEINGFLLAPQEDGTFIFFPDEATTRTYTFFEGPRTYTYDPAKREFFWETDYYGKRISHRARFINDNVLAMMLISGRKVMLDLYQRKPTEQE